MFFANSGTPYFLDAGTHSSDSDALCFASGALYISFGTLPTKVTVDVATFELTLFRPGLGFTPSSALTTLVGATGPLPTDTWKAPEPSPLG